jgi:hypothetical protein
MPIFTECGTPAAYRRHLRRGERACWSCKRAHAQETNDAKLAPKRRRVLLEALAGFDRYHTGRRERAA